jgi:hypothetical protein
MYMAINATLPLMLFATVFMATALSGQPNPRYGNRDDNYSKGDPRYGKGDPRYGNGDPNYGYGDSKYGNGNYERNPASRDFRTQPPGRRHVWMDGDWTWYHGRYVYQPGQWVIPPKPNLAWAPGRWDMSRNGRVWRKGYWCKPNGQPYTGDWKGGSDRDYGYYEHRDRRNEQDRRNKY